MDETNAPLSAAQRSRIRRLSQPHEHDPSEAGGELHPALCLAQPLRSERLVGLLAPVLRQQQARCRPEPRQRDDQARIALALSGAVEGYDVRGCDPEQRPRPWSVRTPGPRDRVPGVDRREVAAVGRSVTPVGRSVTR